MTADMTCVSCAMGDHHLNEQRGHTVPGLIGGWRCSCPCTIGKDVPPRVLTAAECADIERLFGALNPPPPSISNRNAGE